VSAHEEGGSARRRPLLTALVTLVGLVGLVGLTCLLYRARGPLPTPPIESWGAAQRWYARIGPAVAVMSAARVVATAVAGWLVVATGLQVLTLLTPRSGLRWLADLIAPRSLTRLVHGLAGLSLTAGLALPAPSAGMLDTPQAGVAILRPVDTPPGPPTSGTATLRLLDLPDAPPAVAAPVPPEAPSPVRHREVVVVEHGDSLWSIARDAVVDAGLAEPGDDVVASYWERLIAHNRAALVVPSNPDLIYPGQPITLPEPVPPS